MALGLEEHLDDARGILENRRVLDHDLAADDADPGSDPPAEDAPQTTVGALRFEAALGHERPEAMHPGRVQVVVLEKALDRAPLVRVTVAERRRHALLMLERELILMAAGREVERVANLPEKVARFEHRGDLALGDDPLLHDLAQAPDLELDARDPKRRVQVAKPALAFLDMRLEEVDRAAVLRMPLCGLLERLLDEAVGVASHDVGLDDPIEVQGELGIAAQEAGVEQRGLHLKVPRGEASALRHAAHRVADLQAGVPEAVENLLRDALDERVHLPLIEKEQVDVGKRVELGAAVAALRQHRAFLVDACVAPGEVGHRRRVKEVDRAVHHLGERRDDLRAARSRDVPGFEPRPRPLDSRLCDEPEVVLPAVNMRERDLVGGKGERGFGIREVHGIGYRLPATGNGLQSSPAGSSCFSGSR